MRNAFAARPRDSPLDSRRWSCLARIVTQALIKNGPGVTVTAGWRYEGQLVDGQWHGQGVLTYKTGETLRGEFRTGKIHNGEGTLRKKGSDLSPLRGKWVEGEFSPAATAAAASAT